MSRTTRIAVIAAAGISVLALASPAAAVPGTVRTGSTGGAAYSGAVKTSLVGSATIVAGGVSATCTAITINGTTTSGGAVTFTAPGSFSCGTAVTLGSGATGNLAYNAAGSKASLTNFKLTAIVGGLVSCTYGGNFTNLPVSNPVTIALNGVVANKTAGSFLCPSSATITANIALQTGAGAALYLTS